MHQVNKLIMLREEGLVPGPKESEDSFQKRVKFCRTLHKEFIKENPSKEHLISPLYKIENTWVPVIYSNHSLPKWQGGIAWIFQLEEGGPLGAFIQLAKKLKKKGRSLFGIYSKEEIIAHELLHISRMAFNEPKFEEILAYRTSPSKFRRWVGPLFQSSKESFLLLFLFSMILLGDIFLLATGYDQIYQQFFWFKLIPIGLLGWMGVRLCKKQRTFQKTMHRLKPLTGNNLYPFLATLTDDEIERFSKARSDEIIAYTKSLAEHSLRGRLQLTFFL